MKRGQVGVAVTVGGCGCLFNDNVTRNQMLFLMWKAPATGIEFSKVGDQISIVSNSVLYLQLLMSLHAYVDYPY